MAKPDKKPVPTPEPPPAPAPPPDPVLAPAPLTPMFVTPGVPVTVGEVALRCSACNQLSRWQRVFLDRHKGSSLVCPICGTAGACDG